MIVVYILAVLRNCLIWPIQIQLSPHDSTSPLQFLSSTMNRFSYLHNLPVVKIFCFLILLDDSFNIAPL